MIIEFMGMPRSGKTTQINLLEKDLVITDREIEREITADVTDSYEYNKQFFMLVEKRLREASAQRIILDRGFHDATAWIITEKKLGNITERQASELHECFGPMQKKIDKVVFMIVKPETCRERHKDENGVSDDYVLQEEYLQTLYESYEELAEESTGLLIREGTIEEIHEKILAYINE